MWTGRASRPTATVRGSLRPASTSARQETASAGASGPFTSSAKRYRPRSFAIGAGSAVAVEAADITVIRNDLAAVADAILLSRATRRKIRQNLVFAFGYNVLGIPLAALGFMNPVIAGAAMAMSSVSVVGNALTLRRFHPVA